MELYEFGQRTPDPAAPIPTALDAPKLKRCKKEFPPRDFFTNPFPTTPMSLSDESKPASTEGNSPPLGEPAQSLTPQTTSGKGSDPWPTECPMCVSFLDKNPIVPRVRVARGKDSAWKRDQLMQQYWSAYQTACPLMSLDEKV